ncbi:MAG TPA: hypothetical protein VMY41_18775, partial [Thermohalobaculum sp.]|nr:hypothetical protein [Thermohalobaculum sp.]
MTVFLTGAQIKSFDIRRPSHLPETLIQKVLNSNDPKFCDDDIRGEWPFVGRTISGMGRASG